MDRRNTHPTITQINFTAEATLFTGRQFFPCLIAGVRYLVSLDDGILRENRVAEFPREVEDAEV